MFEACRKAVLKVFSNPKKRPIDGVIIQDGRGRRYKVNSNMEIEEISIWSEYNIPKYVRIDKKRIAYTNNGESPSL